MSSTNGETIKKERNHLANIANITEMQFNELGNIVANKEHNDQQIDINADVETLRVKATKNLENQIDSFLKEIGCDTSLDAKFCELDKDSFSLLKEQRKKIDNLKKARFIFKEEEVKEEEQQLTFELDKCIDSLKNFNPHRVSTNTLIWRRFKLVSFILIAVAIAFTLSLVLFSPITSIAGLGTAMGVTVAALLGCFTGKPAVVEMHTQTFGLDVVTKVPEPVPLASMMLPFMVAFHAYFPLSKITVFPEQETKARALDYANIFYYISALSLHITLTVADNPRREILQKMLNQAKRIYEKSIGANEGNYQTATDKGLKLLIAAAVLSSESYKEKQNIMEEKISLTNNPNEKTSVNEIIGTKRHCWNFWGKKTRSEKFFYPEGRKLLMA